MMFKVDFIDEVIQNNFQDLTLPHSRFSPKFEVRRNVRQIRFAQVNLVEGEEREEKDEIREFHLLIAMGLTL
ncbi:Hypothetical predicted protein [Octopus vulgaris]|uniref:Uncharacterized protein n=1 Tax=Octopus vulgaris TaxID=6645 RepID=A0AA36AV05_OCTVU|nr:Hypothetical predicted protein [Octopus vulgaris]